MMEYDDYAELDPNTKLTSELVEAIQGHVLRGQVECFEAPWAFSDADRGYVEGEAGHGYYTAQASIEICEGTKKGKFLVLGWAGGKCYKLKAKTVKELEDAVWWVQASISERCLKIH